MFRAQKYIEALERFQPDIIKTCKAAMEKTDAAAVVPLDAGWCDVGSWTALWEVRLEDRYGRGGLSDQRGRRCR